MFNSRAAAAEGAGDAGIRERAGVPSPPPPPVVVDLGMLAMTADRMVPGEMPIVAGAQAEAAREHRTAIAPTR